MTNTNVISIAPNQPVSPRTTSQGTQSRYKPPARHGRKNFGSTLEQVHAKLDELKKNIQDLQDTDKKPAQVEDDTTKLDTTTETSAQGTSDTPQDAQKAIRNEELGIRNDSEVIVKEKIKPADIFFNKDKIVDAIKINTSLKPNSENLTVETKIPEDLDDTTKLVNEQVANIFTASSMAYLFGTNSESLLMPKIVASADVDEVPKVDAVQNLMTLMPQTKDDNAQSMLNMLGGRTWRPLESPPQINPSSQAQPLEVQPVQVQPTVQAPNVEMQPAQVQPTVQAPNVELQPAQVQQTIQAPNAEIQPAQIQPTVQTPNAEIQPAQVQQTVQAPNAEIQPAQVQQTIQAPNAELQPAQVQPTIQTPNAEMQPAQVQSTVQIPNVEMQPVQVQPTVQAPNAEMQPAQVQPTIQTPNVEMQPTQVQSTVQTPNAELQPAQVQPTIQTPNVEIQPTQVQPTIQTPNVEMQPVQVQPTVQTPNVEIQPVQVQQTVQAPNAELQPAQVQSTVQAPNVEMQPVQVQPTVQTPNAELQPVQVQPTIQTPNVEMQPVQVQPTVQTPNAELQPVQVQPTIQTPNAEIQPIQVQSTVEIQPVITPQRVDERPAVQNFSELLGVNVQVEDAPTAVPVTPSQSTPQQFEQNSQQRDAQNFQGQNFQSTPEALQVQQVSTGGEIFAANLTATNHAPQSQPTATVQAPDAPPPLPQNDFDVPAQIVRQARLIRTTENTEMVIKLNPEHLGELTLRVSVSANGAINASFHSDNAQVRTIIENSLVQLRQELNNVGLKVENVDVYAGLSDGSLMNGQGGQAWQQNPRQRQGNRQLDFDSLERDVDSTAPVNESTAEGVDYSV